LQWNIFFLSNRGFLSNLFEDSFTNTLYYLAITFITFILLALITLLPYNFLALITFITLYFVGPNYIYYLIPRLASITFITLYLVDAYYIITL